MHRQRVKVRESSRRVGGDGHSRYVPGATCRPRFDANVGGVFSVFRLLLPLFGCVGTLPRCNRATPGSERPGLVFSHGPNPGLELHRPLGPIVLLPLALAHATLTTGLRICSEQSLGRFGLDRSYATGLASFVRDGRACMCGSVAAIRRFQPSLMNPTGSGNKRECFCGLGWPWARSRAEEGGQGGEISG